MMSQLEQAQAVVRAIGSCCGREMLQLINDLMRIALVKSEFITLFGGRRGPTAALQPAPWYCYLHVCAWCLRPSEGAQSLRNGAQPRLQMPTGSTFYR